MIRVSASLLKRFRDCSSVFIALPIPLTAIPKASDWDSSWSLACCACTAETFASRAVASLAKAAVSFLPCLHWRVATALHNLRDWLLELAGETMEREGNEDAAHDFDHLMRVMALADTIAAREGGDMPTIWAAVALHDIGQPRELRHGGDHALIGANMAAELLQGTLFPQATIPAVQQAIREHRMTGGVLPGTLEGRVLYDADKIDSLGAIGIGRLYMITGRYNQKVYTPVPTEIEEPVDPV